MSLPPTPDTSPLFDLPPDAEIAGMVKPSADRRRTELQLQRLTSGYHPLAAVVPYLRLHEEAAPVADRNAPGRRCGNCWYRRPMHRGFAKCFVDVDNPTDAKPHSSSLRITHGAATDVRAWWPACMDHTYGDVDLSPDAARFVPGGVS